MRLFFALDLSAKQKVQLSEWRDQAFGPWQRAVSASNFHITLAFLGNVEEASLEPLLNNSEHIEQSKIEITLNRIGFFNKPRVAYLGCDDIPDTLLALHKDIRRVIGEAKIAVENRTFVPHVTLFRGNKQPPPAPIIPANFEFEFTQFSLMQSVSSEHGVHYPVIKSWPLSSFIRPR